ncbi:MAG: LysR family regulatory protein CidR [uncultured Caballeronia sp.]|nr:MAG: LysR family regulatory protein CidR [uncultured Caballeronia sp.]
MVKALEDEVGSPLLLREGRQMVLTDAGQIVWQRGVEGCSRHTHGSKPNSTISARSGAAR